MLNEFMNPLMHTIIFYSPNNGHRTKVLRDLKKIHSLLFDRTIDYDACWVSNTDFYIEKVDIVVSQADAA